MDLPGGFKGSIQEYECKKGISYRAMIDMPRGGEREQKTRAFADWKYNNAKSLAISWLIDLNEKIEACNYVEYPDQKFNSFMEIWIENEKSNVKQRTIDKRWGFYKNHVSNYFSDQKLEDLSTYKLRTFFQEHLPEKDLSSSTIKGIYHLLNGCLSTASERAYLTKNPLDPVSTPSKSQKEITYYSQDQFEEILEALKEYEAERARQHYSKYPIFYTAIHTGMRIGEILGLKPDDLDYKNQILEIRRSLNKDSERGLYLGSTKNSSSRNIKLTQKNTELLKEAIIQRRRMKRQNNDWGGAETIFVTSKGNYIWYSTIRRTLKKVLKETELPEITLHGFRHTHATELYEAGADDKFVCERLGHDSVKTTKDVYTHVSDSKQEEVIEDYENNLEDKDNPGGLEMNPITN